MRCPYCFQEIDARSERCSHCLSRLPERVASGGRQVPVTRLPEAGGSVDEPALPLTNRQLFALLGGAVLVLVCLCAVLAGLAQPELLPQQIIAAAPFLASPTPLPNRQVTTRAAVVTSTPASSQTACSRRAEFCLSLPAGWLVIDQGLPSWQREVDSLAQRYEWLPDLLDASTVPRVARLRATSPELVTPAGGHLARLTAGETDVLSSTLSLGEMETLIQAEPERAATLLDPTLLTNARVRRIERERVSGQEALAIELEATALLAGSELPVRSRLYLFPANQRLYLLSYLADETTTSTHRQLFEQIIQSFAIEEP